MIPYSVLLWYLPIAFALPSVVTNGNKELPKSIQNPITSTASLVHEPSAISIDDIDLNSLDPNYWTAVSLNLDEDEQLSESEKSGQDHHLRRRDIPRSDSNEIWSSDNWAKWNGKVDKRLERLPGKLRYMPPYITDEPGNPLKRKPHQLISPANGLPRKYFNMSDFRPWRPSHDAVRPQNRLSWREPHDDAYCLLAGVGRREVYWQPEIARKLFHTPYDYNKDRAINPAFQNFWNRDPVTGKWKSFSIFLATANPHWVLMKDVANEDITERVHPHLQHRTEACRLYCRTCFDAAQETGAEGFICSRAESENASHDIRHSLSAASGICRTGMVTGDPVGRDNICHWVGRNYICGQTFRKDFAQEGAPRNVYPSLSCEDFWACEGKKCMLNNNTMVMAEGKRCRLVPAVRVKNSRTSRHPYSVPRFGLFAYEDLASAMADPTIKVYYTDFTPEPGTFEKAILLGSTYIRTKHHTNNYKVLDIRPASQVLMEEMGPAWMNYKEGDPTPLNWMETRYYNYRDALDVYKGPVGFGTIPGGTYMNASDNIPMGSP